MDKSSTVYSYLPLDILPNPLALAKGKYMPHVGTSVNPLKRDGLSKTLPTNNHSQTVHNSGLLWEEFIHVGDGVPEFHQLSNLYPSRAGFK